MLADHFIQGRNYEKGAEYSELTARQARRKHARTEAIAYANKAVACLEKSPRSEASQRNINDARCNLANYYTILNWHVEAREVVDPIKDLAHKIGYKKSFPVINGVIGSYYVLAEGDMLKGTSYLLKAVEASKRIGDVYSLW